MMVLQTKRTLMPPRMRPQQRIITAEVVALRFARVLHEAGIPVQYWDRMDMIVQNELAKRLREFCWQEWQTRPAIVGGDTLQEAIQKLLRYTRGMRG